MIRLNHSQNVDPTFAALVDTVVNKILLRSRPAQVYVIEIDGWFDYKWQGFSGTVMHEIAVWRHKITVPPFHPSRVINESNFHLCPDGSDYKPSDALPLHINQPGSNNLRRYASEVASSAVFVWYSNANAGSDKSSVMVYTVDRNDGSAWYAGFKQNGTWTLTQTKGISRREMQALLATGGTEQIVGPETPPASFSSK